MSGWIKLHYKIADWEWYKDTNTMRLFLHILLKANYTAKRWQGLDILPGQFVTSRETLAFETGLSEQQIRTSLNKLKSTSEITSTTTSKYTLITVSNWIEYQQGNQPINQQSTSNQPADNQQVTTTKEYKKEIKKEDNNIELLSKEKPKKISINELSVDSIAQWLNQKRALGKYLSHDEFFILEYFKNYCQSKGKVYTNYVAALKNAFEWDSCQPTKYAGKYIGTTQPSKFQQGIDGIAAARAKRLAREPEQVG